MATQPIKRLGVLTSGSDAPGMNAALRAVVRTALHRKLTVYAIHDGYRGLTSGGKLIKKMAWDYRGLISAGKSIKKMTWDSVGGILQYGGTVIGSGQCPEFHTREGRLQAAHNLIAKKIDGLVVIGGDGSQTGADLLHREWSELVADLVKEEKISQADADRIPQLAVVGVPASIDNHMSGTEMTIGADTALHRITSAIDRITSTAASHQRTFVIEVMGEESGYLALMGAQASGADWVLIPESPPDVDDWEAKMCQVLKAGRKMGRRDSMVVVAEGARDRNGKPISVAYVKKVLEERLGEDTRLTVLGYVQRGGAPSALDRYLATILGYTAVEEILKTSPENNALLLGIQDNELIRTPLHECVEKTGAITKDMAANQYDKAMAGRSIGYNEAFQTFRTLVQALPHPPKEGQKKLRLAIMNAGSLAPGMNTAARVATRLAIDKGHTMLGIRNGFRGFVDGHIEELDWMSVDGWSSQGGAELGTNRHIPEGSDFYTIARNIEEHNIQGLLVVGGWTGYLTVHEMMTKQSSFPAFNIPIICLPATINNNLPGSELSVGADTALNNILEAVDKIKQSAVATRRCFVVEVMGRYCGYLALMSGFISGAERVYLHEEGVSLANLQEDINRLKQDFARGKPLGLVIRNENVSPFYSTEFMVSLFEEEGGDLFDVRQSILGHLQRGGDPSPLDRIRASHLATRCIEFLISEASAETAACRFIGIQDGKVQTTDVQDLPRVADIKLQRPKKQWWLALRPIARALAQSGPKS